MYAKDIDDIDRLHKQVNHLRHYYYRILGIRKAANYLERWVEVMNHIRELHPEYADVIDDQIKAKKRKLSMPNKPPMRVVERKTDDKIDWNQRRLLKVKVKDLVHLEQFQQSVKNRLEVLIKAAQTAHAKIIEQGLSHDAYCETTKALDQINRLQSDMGLFKILMTR